MFKLRLRQRNRHGWRVGKTYLLGTRVHTGPKQELRMESQMRSEGEDLEMQAENFPHDSLQEREFILRCFTPTLSDATSSSHLTTL